MVFRKLNKTNVSPILISREKVRSAKNTDFWCLRKLSVTTIFYFNARLHFINHMPIESFLLKKFGGSMVPKTENGTEKRG